MWYVGGQQASNVAWTRKQKDMLQPLVERWKQSVLSRKMGVKLTLEIVRRNAITWQLSISGIVPRCWILSICIHPHVQIWMAMKSMLACSHLIVDWGRFTEWKLSHCSEADIAVLRWQLQKTSNTYVAMTLYFILSTLPYYNSSTVGMMVLLRMTMSWLTNDKSKLLHQ